MSADKKLASTLRAISLGMEAGLGPKQIVSDPTLRLTFPPELVEPLLNALDRGSTLEKALEASGWLLPHELAIVGAAERSGDLAGGLQRLVADVERREAERKRLQQGVAYPFFLLNAASLILPLPILVTAGPVAYLAKAIWLPLILGILWIVTVMLIPGLPATDPRRRGPRQILRALPVGSQLARRLDSALFLRVFEQGIRSGLGAQAAFDLALGTVEQPTLRQGLEQARQRLQRGAGLAESLAEGGVFRPETLAFVAQGELTGTLDTSLARAQQMEEEAGQQALRWTMRTLTGLVFGLVVLGIALKIILGFSQVLRSMDQVLSF